MAKPRSSDLSEVEAAIDQSTELLQHLRQLLTALDEAWITVAEAAELMHTGDASVLRLLEERRLGSYTTDDGQWRISRQHAILLAAARSGTRQR